MISPHDIPQYPDYKSVCNQRYPSSLSFRSFCGGHYGRAAMTCRRRRAFQRPVSAPHNDGPRKVEALVFQIVGHKKAPPPPPPPELRLLIRNGRAQTAVSQFKCKTRSWRFRRLLVRKGRKRGSPHRRDFCARKFFYPVPWPLRRNLLAGSTVRTGYPSPESSTRRQSLPYIVFKGAVSCPGPLRRISFYFLSQ